jgi:hypothetical protein
MSDVERVREEMYRMAMGVHRDQLADRYLAEFYPRLKRAKPAKKAPKRPDRDPREIIQDDERILRELRLFNPPKSNVAIGNHVGVDGGRVSEVLKATGARSYTEVLRYLNDVVRPALERGDDGPYRAWAKAKKT